MGKWLLNFETAKVGGKAAIELMCQPGKLNSGAKLVYGFGLFDGTNNFYVAEECADILTQLNAGVNSHDRCRKAKAEDFTLPGR